MQATAIARNLRTGDRKVGVICNMIRGKKVEDALQILRFCPRNAARMVDKALRSAIANGSQGEARLDLGKARVIKAVADTAGAVPYAKRFMPRAMGRAAQMRKRMCHLTIVVTDEPAARAARN